jgi:hypothetical protein
LLDSFKLLSPWINLHRKHKLKMGFKLLLHLLFHDLISSI